MSQITWDIELTLDAIASSWLDLLMLVYDIRSQVGECLRSRWTLNLRLRCLGPSLSVASLGIPWELLSE